LLDSLLQEILTVNNNIQTIVVKNEPQVTKS